MKDEEMAETYFESECLHSYADTEEELKEDVVTAFLAGLKAGRPQWHKVANGDLPKIGSSCLVYLANDFVIIARLREDNVWTTNGHNAFENVIAWCEIPTFDKE